MSALDELLSEIDESLEDILYLISNYEPSHPRLKILSDLGQKILEKPEYYSLDWGNNIDDKTSNSFNKFCLMMEIYIEHNTCYGFTMNNPVIFSGENSRKIRCRAIKYFMNNSLAADLKHLTTEVVSILNESMNGASVQDQCMAAFALNNYLIVITDSVKKMGMNQHANDAINIIMESLDSSVFIKEYAKEIFNGEEGRADLCTSLGKIH